MYLVKVFFNRKLVNTSRKINLNLSNLWISFHFPEKSTDNFLSVLFLFIPILIGEILPFELFKKIGFCRLRNLIELAFVGFIERLPYGFSLRFIEGFEFLVRCSPVFPSLIVKKFLFSRHFLFLSIARLNVFSNHSATRV